MVRGTRPSTVHVRVASESESRRTGRAPGFEEIKEKNRFRRTAADRPSAHSEDQTADGAPLKRSSPIAPALGTRLPVLVSAIGRIREGEGFLKLRKEWELRRIPDHRKPRQEQESKQCLHDDTEDAGLSQCLIQRS